MRKTFFISLIIILGIANWASAMEYKDVPLGYWAYNEINRLDQENIIKGYTKYNYYPDKNITRAEFCSMVIKALGMEERKPEKFYSFYDVDRNYWAWNYIQNAVNLGIFNPSDEGYFYPDANITRSDVIVFLANLLRTENITRDEALYALNSNYNDYEDIPDWLKVSAGKAEKIDVIAKEPPRENYLDYDKYVSRAQAAVFLSKMRREIDSYKALKLKEETTPKTAEGIKIENVLIDGDVATIPAKTVLPITITGQIGSKISMPGEMFKARFSDNIVDDENHLLFSKDIILIGKILDTTKAFTFFKNGEIIFELSAANKNNLYTRIMAIAEYETPIAEANKVKKAVKTVIKGSNFKIRDGQIIYTRLYQPIRVNIVTSEILD